MYHTIRYLVFLALFLFLGLVVATTTIYFILAPQLPPVATLKNIQLQTPLRIFSDEGLLMAEFGEKRRIPVPFETIPRSLINAFLAAEDDRFFEHPGVDYQGLLRAGYSLLTTGQKAQGGSTITMQLARNFFLTREKSYLRKINEIILALKIENVLTKREILTLYLNKIYLGKRAYGIAAAAKVYYGKSLSELTLAQTAMVAGLPKAPSKFNPIANPKRALERRNYVLKRMWEVGYITKAAYFEAKEKPVTARYHGRKIEVYAPYVAEIIRNQLTEQYGEESYSMGLNVYTTIEAKHQNAANRALANALIKYDQRHGYRGAIGNYDIDSDQSPERMEQFLDSFSVIGPLFPAITTQITDKSATLYLKGIGNVELEFSSLSWARKQLSVNSRGPVPKQINDVLNVGDVVYLSQNNDQAWALAQHPEVQGALIAVRSSDGAVTALNGGFDYYESKFNRVTQSKRQPGSSFKPFIYSAALEKGYTAATIINDAPVVIDDPGLDETWRPSNYSGKFYGPTRLRSALTHSRNLVSIRLLRDISPSFAIDYATRFGFKPSQLPNNLSLALGSGSAAPWDMARAYAAIANGGYRVEPYLIKRVEDSDGNILIQNLPDTVCPYCFDELADKSTDEEADFRPSAQRIIPPENVYTINSLLRDVILRGTGRSALQLGRTDLAGKTGTTNDQVDAWFNGFHPELVAISWVGFDNPKTLGRYETGGRAALPMWIDFMRIVLEDTPESPLILPEDMMTVAIDPKTGLLANINTPNPIIESFRPEYLPAQSLPTSGFDRAGEQVPIEDLF